MIHVIMIDYHYSELNLTNLTNLLNDLTCH